MSENLADTFFLCPTLGQINVENFGLDMVLPSDRGKMIVILHQALLKNRIQNPLAKAIAILYCECHGWQLETSDRATLASAWTLLMGKISEDLKDLSYLPEEAPEWQRPMLKVLQSWLDQTLQYRTLMERYERLQSKGLPCGDSNDLIHHFFTSANLNHIKMWSIATLESSRIRKASIS